VPEGYAAFYVTLAGKGLLSLEHLHEPIPLAAKDIYLVADGSPHRLHDGSDSPPRSAFECLARHSGAVTSSDDDSPSTVLLFGLFGLRVSGFNPISSGVPSLLHLTSNSCPTLGGLDGLVELIRREQEPNHPGRQTITNRLVQIVLIQCLRAFFMDRHSEKGAGQSKNGTSWLAATLDPVIGPAVGLIHSQPEEPWTVTELAGKVNLSKSAFSERFRDAVGKPPLQYLTDFRIQSACQFLRETDLGIKQVASRVGYESASSFSNAFKRWTGVAPANFRKQGNSSSNRSSQ
jgi:AraC-like DNA-binding protein